MNLTCKPLKMETNKILNADILDIIFDGRNKQYGAYDLRKTYNRRLVKALAAMFGLLLIVIATSVLAGNEHKSIRLIERGEIYLSNVTDNPTPPIVPPPAKIQPKLEIIKFVKPEIVTEPVDDVIPMQTNLDNVNIGAISQEGTKEVVVGAGIVEPKGTGEITRPKIDEPGDGGFVGIQIEAQFPGGADAWIKFLQRNLRNEIPVDNGAPAGNYTVIVSFLVDKSGNISEVKAETNPGYGTADEAIRVIQRGPKWKPAVQNGRNVIYRQRQSITFQVAEE
jgi:protein TonB